MSIQIYTCLYWDVLKDAHLKLVSFAAVITVVTQRNQGLARILISVLQLFGEVICLYCFPFSLSCSNLKLHKTLEMKNILNKKKNNASVNV